MVDDIGEDQGRGFAVNAPLDRGVGDESWWTVVDQMLPVLADMFKPSFIVSQHGCDSHALDPLAHLRLTTASYRRAAELVDKLAHEHAGGRWFATGGGGYDAYRVVPRSWALVWLTQAHREVPAETPEAWRERWSEAAEVFEQGPMPVDLVDPPRTVAPDPDVIVARQLKRARESLLQSLRLQASC
jgi:acetoin utilization protein AcuC